MHMLILLFIGYISFISLIAIIVTVIDKRAAERGKSRISENALLIISAIGGSVAMFVTMIMARHKTKHLKFMVGIPIILILQVLLLVFVVLPLIPIN